MKISFLFFLLVALGLQAQNTLTMAENEASPEATLSDVAWIQGHWKGEALGGIVEEIWSPPLGNSMMFVFKMVTDDKVGFYEIGHIQEVDGSLILQLKHFHGNLEGWEEKEETVDFRLVKIEKDRVFFDGLTMEKISDQVMNVYVVIGHEDGSTEEAKFHYKREG